MFATRISRRARLPRWSANRANGSILCSSKRWQLAQRRTNIGGASWVRNEARLWGATLVVGGGIFAAYKYGYRERLPGNVSQLVQAAKELETEGRYGQAIKLYTQAVNVVKASPFSSASRFFVIGELANCFGMAGENGKAAQAYREALACLDDVVLNDVAVRKSAAAMCDRLAQIALENSDQQEAERCYFQALDVLKVPAETVIEVTKLWEKNLLAGRTNGMEMERPVDLVSRVEPVGMEFAALLNNLAMLYLEQGLVNQALPILHRCYAVLVFIGEQDNEKAEAVLSLLKQIQDENEMAQDDSL